MYFWDIRRVIITRKWTQKSVHSVTHCRRAVCTQSHVTTSHAFYFYKFLLCVFNSIFDISFPKIHVCLYFPMCQSCEHILRVQSTAVTGKKFSHTEIKNRILCFLCLDFILFLERKRKRIEAWNGTKCFIFPFIAYWHCWCPLVDDIHTSFSFSRSFLMAMNSFGNDILVLLAHFEAHKS